MNYDRKIAVIEIRIESLKDDIYFNAEYSQALLVFRYFHAVVGQKIFPIENGKISLTQIKDYLPAITPFIWRHHMERQIQHESYSPFISVVVCTYNHPLDLKNCLDSLSKLNYKNKEVIVVDNCPHIPDTYKLVTEYPDIKYIAEERKGLDVARNRGIRESIGEFVAFTDDDARVDAFWLDNLVRNFKNPITAVVTGITMPYELETDSQLLFEKLNPFNRGFFRKEYDLTNHNPTAAGRTGAGVNMAIRKELLHEIGYFNEALDGGTASCSGGDSEFFYRCLAKGFRIIYEPCALVWHTHKKEYSSLLSTIHGYGIGVFAWWTSILLNENEFKLIINAPLWFLRYHAFNLLKALLKFKSAKYLRLRFAEFIGALQGPFKYLAARRNLITYQKSQSKNLIKESREEIEFYS